MASICPDDFMQLDCQTLDNSNLSSQDVFASGLLYGEQEEQAEPAGFQQGAIDWTIGLKDCLRTSACDSQEYDATCTSRSTKQQCKQLQQRFADQQTQDASAVCCSEQVLVPSQQDATGVDQDTRAHQWQRLHSKDRSPALRAAQQQEELMDMIRSELTTEQELAPHCSFLEQSNVPGEHVTPQMRMIVCSWLSEVACEFNMQQETLFLAVALMDRFMSCTKGIPRTVLQLVAVASVLLASKQDEVVHPSVEELTDIAANCFQVQDLLRMERVLLDGLSWRIKTPTTYTFLHLFTQTTAVLRAAAQAAPACAQQSDSSEGQHWAYQAPISEPMQGSVVAKAAYLTELAMLDYSSLAFRPSQVAAASLLLAQSWSEQGAAVQEMQQITGYRLADLQTCMSRLLHLHQCASASETSDALAPFTFVKEKYSQDCWLQASLQEVPAAAATLNPICNGQGPDQEMRNSIDMPTGMLLSS